MQIKTLAPEKISKLSLWMGFSEMKERWLLKCARKDRAAYILSPLWVTEVNSWPFWDETRFKGMILRDWEWCLVVGHIGNEPKFEVVVAWMIITYFQNRGEIILKTKFGLMKVFSTQNPGVAKKPKMKMIVWKGWWHFLALESSKQTMA